MEESRPQLLDIRPKKNLFFEGPFTNVVTAYIHLTNPQDYAVCFKVKTTVPKRYCVRPSCGILKASEDIQVAVMLQPFAYDMSEKTRHKFMIQSMVHPTGDEEVPLDKLWKEAEPSKIMDMKLVCLLRMPGELAVEPSHEITFDGPFKKPVLSEISLTNPSAETIGYQLVASSSKIILTPQSGTLDANTSTKIAVELQPFDLSGTDRPRERILIRSLIINPNESRVLEEVIAAGPTSETMLKCVFTVRGVAVDPDDAVKSGKSALSHTSAADSTTRTKSNLADASRKDLDLVSQKLESVSKELETARYENKILKRENLEFRREAISGACLTSTAGSSGTGVGRSQGALGLMANIPPILYLILALIIGLIIGKFTL